MSLSLKYEIFFRFFFLHISNSTAFNDFLLKLMWNRKVIGLIYEYYTKYRKSENA